MAALVMLGMVALLGWALVLLEGEGAVPWWLWGLWFLAAVLVVLHGALIFMPG